jgi:hypothetical protein
VSAQILIDLSSSRHSGVRKLHNLTLGIKANKKLALNNNPALLQHFNFHWYGNTK